MSNNTAHRDWRLPVLRSVAETIQDTYPEAASEIRSVIRSLEPPPRPDLTELFSNK